MDDRKLNRGEEEEKKSKIGKNFMCVDSIFHFIKRQDSDENGLNQGNS